LISIPDLVYAVVEDGGGPLLVVAAGDDDGPVVRGPQLVPETSGTSRASSQSASDNWM